jgi:replicative DNA helicase
MKKEIFDYLKQVREDIEKAKDVKDKQDKLLFLLEAARTYEGEDKLISSFDIAEKIKNAPPEEKIFSHIKGLNDILDGFRRKQLIVISAATKSGKTSFCVDLTTKWADKNPIWLPFEEGAEELVRKFLRSK